VENVQEFAYFYGDYSELVQEFDQLLSQDQEKLPCHKQPDLV
jgi:hypothetical protein